MPTFKAVILSAKNQVKADGTANIKIRLTHKRKVTYISTDLYIIPSYFDNKQGVAAGGGNHEHINITIGRKIINYRESVLKLGEFVNYMDVAALKDHILNGIVKDGIIDFYQFAEKLIIETSNIGTARNYRDTLKSLKMFKDSRLLAAHINLNFLYAYERWLRDRGVENGIINYMKSFRAMFNKCRDYYNDEDTGQIRIPNYPFRKYKMPKRRANSAEHVLTPAELKRLIKYKTVSPGEQFAKDMFLLMVYLIGIETKDLFYLKKPYAGRIKYDRFKTGGEFTVKLEPEAKAIIKQYSGEKYLLNINQRFEHHTNFYKYINRYLHGEKHRMIQGIFAKLEINKPVTTKWARHTWATIARNNCSINKDDVALCLGHKDQDNRVTDIYIKYDTTIIDAANRKVLSFIGK